MHTIINSLNSPHPLERSEVLSAGTYRKPNYECQDENATFKVIVYVPGVDAAGVEIEARRTDLIITAKKAHFVRVNWQSLHLENAQLDYRLRLRLGTGFDYAGMQAEIHDGVLTVTLRKKTANVSPTVRLRKVA